MSVWTKMRANKYFHTKHSPHCWWKRFFPSRSGPRCLIRVSASVVSAHLFTQTWHLFDQQTSCGCALWCKVTSLFKRHNSYRSNQSAGPLTCHFYRSATFPLHTSPRWSEDREEGKSNGIKLLLQPSDNLRRIWGFFYLEFLTEAFEGEAPSMTQTVLQPPQGVHGRRVVRNHRAQRKD